MRWLVDLDTAVKDGTLTADRARELKLRASEAIVSYAINLALFAGVVMVIGGTVVWIKDHTARAVIGSALASIGALALVRGGSDLKIVANATAIIGAALAVGALTALLFKGRIDRLAISTMLGLPLAILGWSIRRFSLGGLSVLGGWILFLGAAVHLVGVLTTLLVDRFSNGVNSRTGRAGRHHKCLGRRVSH